MNYRFTVVLANYEVMTPELTEALYAAGCDDATAWSANREAFVTFDRDAESLEAAIRSALADVRKAGCTAKHTIVESPEPVG